jgi:methyl-accepting chemotaxis protein
MFDSIFHDVLLILVTLAISVPIILFILRRIYGRSLIYEIMVYVTLSLALNILVAFTLGRVGISPITISISILFALVSFIFTINTLQRHIVKPIQGIRSISHQIAHEDLPALQKSVRALAEGNLEATLVFPKREVNLKSKNEVGELGEEFNEMIAEICKTGQSFNEMGAVFRGLIMQLNNSVQALSRASTQLASLSSTTDLASSQIGLSIQQVAKSTSQQTESVTRTASFVEEMNNAINGVANGAMEQANSVGSATTLSTQISTSIRQISNNAGEVTRSAASAAALAQEGSQTVRATIEDMESIRQKVKISADKVLEMGERSKKIETIVETIEEISTQTNLLALNAAIEAARAGVHGKGFAVVASEVRKLADRAGSYAKDISEIVQSIQEVVTEAASAMETAASEVETGVLKSGKAGEALEKILGAVETVNTRASGTVRVSGAISLAVDELVKVMESVASVVEENVVATQEMSSNSSEVTQAVENIASISEQNSAAAEEVSAAAEEMTGQAQEVSTLAASLKEMAEKLNALLSHFKFDN